MKHLLRYKWHPSKGHILNVCNWSNVTCVPTLESTKIVTTLSTPQSFLCLSRNLWSSVTRDWFAFFSISYWWTHCVPKVTLYSAQWFWEFPCYMHLVCIASYSGWHLFYDRPYFLSIGLSMVVGSCVWLLQMKLPPMFIQVPPHGHRLL
jgi:hypothetical protein